MTLTLNTNSWGLHTFGFGPDGYFTLEAAARKKMQDLITPEILAGAQTIREGGTPTNVSAVMHAQNAVQILYFEKQKLVPQNTLVHCIEKLWALVRALMSFIFPDPIDQFLIPFPLSQHKKLLPFLNTTLLTAQTNSSPLAAPSATDPEALAQTPRS